MKSYPLEEALKAQKALRDAAALEPEMFPIQAFIGMISDEIQHLREMGRTDEEIAGIIKSNSKIDITADDIQENYATPEQRQSHYS